MGNDVTEQRQVLGCLYDRLASQHAGIYVGRGWWDLLLKLDSELKILDPSYKVVQIKEKFGGLRFYASFKKEVFNTAQALVNDAEGLSFHVCETCGDLGKLRDSSGWYVTLCDVCENERESKYRV